MFCAIRTTAVNPKTGCTTMEVHVARSDDLVTLMQYAHPSSIIYLGLRQADVETERKLLFALQFARSVTVAELLGKGAQALGPVSQIVNINALAPREEA